tara:strand:+ start:2720 stop:2965 length:246 start_codon:yes stop_codon:yes gene_type:complete
MIVEIDIQSCNECPFLSAQYTTRMIHHLHCEKDKDKRVLAEWKSILSDTIKKLHPHVDIPSWCPFTDAQPRKRFDRIETVK